VSGLAIPPGQAETLTDTFFGRSVGDTFISHDAIHFTSGTYRFWSDHAIVELCKTRIQQSTPGRAGESLGGLLCER
jgi:hypothetical protein